MDSHRLFIFTLVMVAIVICIPFNGFTQPSELIPLLTSQLGVTEKQAEGGAGSLFKLAKNSLPTEKFAKVSQAVPGMDLLLQAAPALPKLKGIGNLPASLGENTKGGLDMASLPAMFAKLGMEQGMVARFIPVVLSFVQSKGGDTVMEMLKGVWQKK